MFAMEKFQEILDSTTDLMEKAKHCQKEEKEELEMRIKSNLQAVKFLSSQIEDPEAKETFLKTFQSLCSSNGLYEKESIRQRKPEKRKDEKYSDVIDDEILKNSRKLKDMAANFNKSLKTDQKLLEKLGEKMHRTTNESGKTVKSLEKSLEKIKSSTFIFLAVMIFMVMYFVIRVF